MRALFFVYVMSLLFFVQCSPPPGQYQGTGDIADGVRSDGKVVSFCTGDECCSEHKECTRICNQIFYKSGKETRKQCGALPKDSITAVEDLIPVLRSPVKDSLEYLNLREDFRLLLALDYKVLVRIIQAYTVDDARIFLTWLGKNQEPVEELLLLKESIRNEIIYEILASAGDRNLYGPVEKGLARKISFDQSFFQLIISSANYDLLQMTHEMIKADICSPKYVGASRTELCVLRVYCKEKENRDNEYVHSESLRNEMARNIKDEEFFRYVEREVLFTGLGIKFTAPIMNNQVCLAVCNDNNRGCE